MLHFVDVLLKDVLEQGRKYPWPKPSRCPRCDHYQVWGHGFVDRFFDFLADALLIKRFRCPHCRCVICCRPASHFSRIQASKETVKDNLFARISTGRWPLGLLTPRQRHWLANLKRKALAYFGVNQIHGLIAAYDRLIAAGHVPISYCF